MSEDKTNKPHWQKEPPTEPGWYKVSDGQSVWFSEVILRPNGIVSCDIDGAGADFWWSHPETLPPLPERGE